MPNPTTVADKAKEARRNILTMIHRAGTSHIASNFSVVDIATVLYDQLQENDEVVWSKGWAAATIYYFLAEQGKITKEDLAKFPNPPFLGLAEPAVPGVKVAGGSMGHGLPVAVGNALAMKRAGKEGIVYCIMSDGEMNEGTTWEAAAFAAHHKLDNLVVIVDANKWQAMGKTADVIDYDNPPLHRKFDSFGFEYTRIDGHDIEQITEALTYSHGGRPMVIICDTIKGKGVSFFEDHLLYHYKHVDADEYARAMEELV